MLRRREFRTKEMLSSLPKALRSRFLSLDASERQLLMNGSPEEREQYGWLPAAAAKKISKLSDPERPADATGGGGRPRLERKPPSAPVAAVRPEGWQPADARHTAELFETSARV